VTVFAYRAADRRGQTIDGVMEAPDARAVVERLQRDAYFPIAVDAQDHRGRLLGLAWPESGRGRVAGRDLVALT
jgi:type II secretory pathway component PulF